MQTLSWYVRRLGAMSAPEATWRLASAIRGGLDRFAAPTRRKPVALSRIRNGSLVPLSQTPALLCRGLSPPGAKAIEYRAEWREELLRRADGVSAHRVRLFGDSDTELGPTIDWNRDYLSGRVAPDEFAPGIDYRDHRVAGDAKWVWELNRHHHLVLLGRAYRATGDTRYAAEAVNQLNDWIDHCPFGYGMNWRSPLELAIRLINWVCLFELIAPSGVWDAEFETRLLGVAYRHLWEVSRKWSRFSSANNHLVGEAAGVFIGSCFFSHFQKSRDWQAESREILLSEIVHQTYSDGGHREQALGYHVFVLQFFLLAGLCARNCGNDFPAEYWARLEKMFDFAGAFCEGGNEVPMFGDCDDGYVLDLGGRRGDVRSWLAVGGALFGRGDLQAISGSQEPSYWLLGADVSKASHAIDSSNQAGKIGSRAFSESGIYLLQDGAIDSPDRISLTFDCGELGFKSIAAHGHADALSITLRVGGKDFLIDPGTYDYFTYPAWRDYFRHTATHNTIQVDGMDQSEILGPFLWGHRARATCTDWSCDGDVVRVGGEHDGYTRLRDAVIHRRGVQFNRTDRAIIIDDELSAGSRHEVAIHFHFAEGCEITALESHVFLVKSDLQGIEIRVDQRLKLNVVRGAEDPIMGWASRGYHRKSPCSVLVGTMQFDRTALLQTRIRVLQPGANMANGKYV